MDASVRAWTVTSSDLLVELRIHGETVMALHVQYSTSLNRSYAIMNVFRDISLAVRHLRKSPGFLLVSVLTLGLGVGANTAVFSVVNALLLRSLPVRDPASVVYLNIPHQPDGANNTGNSSTSFSYPAFNYLRQQKAFSDVVAYVPMNFTGKIAVRAGAQPEEAQGDMVSGNFFSGLGVPMVLGRGFSAADERDHASVVVISHAFWTRRFDRSPSVIGSTLFLKGVPMTVVGVAGQSFFGTEPGSSLDLWIPLQSRPEFNAWGLVPAKSGGTYLTRQDWWCLRLIARLAPGVTHAQAIAEVQPGFSRVALEPLKGALRQQAPPALILQDAKSFPGYEDAVGKPLRVIMGLVGLVLLIALGNIAMLLTARGLARQREFGVRLALGARRAELLRQLFAESAVLVVLGGAAAWAFAMAAVRSLAALAQIETPIVLDGWVLGFTMLVLALAVMLFSLVPLRVALASGAVISGKTGAASARSGRGATLAMRAVTVLQIGFCVVLLVAMGLTVRTLRNLQKAPLGLQAEGVVVFGVHPRTDVEGASLVFYQELLGRLKGLPGVNAVSVSGMRLGAGWSNNNDGYKVDGQLAKNTSGGSTMVRSNTVGAGFFHTMGVPVLQGRDFADADTPTSARVLIVNRTFAKSFFADGNAMGHFVSTGDVPQGMQIVGVVADHKFTSVREEPMPMAWVPYTQTEGVGEMHVAMRVSGSRPLAVLPSVQRVVSSLDPNLPLQDPSLQGEVFAATISQELLFARLAEFFGLLAAALVAVGLYGTLSYRVSLRTPEIGVRMALGAQREQIMRMVLTDSLLLLVLGIAVGVPLAWLLSGGLASVLYGVKPLDLLTYALAMVGVGAVALLSSAIPARRAAGVDPVIALRAE